jgi:hypothetical protein
MSTGEANRRKEQDLGRTIYRSPDLSVWGTPEGLAELTGLPASDPRIVAGSQLTQTIWLAGDGHECGAILQSVLSLLVMVFQQMAEGHPATPAGLARQFAGLLVRAIDEVVAKTRDGTLEERTARRLAAAKPKQ